MITKHYIEVTKNVCIKKIIKILFIFIVIII